MVGFASITHLGNRRGRNSLARRAPASDTVRIDSMVYAFVIASFVQPRADRFAASASRRAIVARLPA